MAHVSRVRRTCTKTVFIDSRDWVSHLNNNPANFTVTLGETVPNVIGLRLMTHSVPYSPTIILTASVDVVDDTAHTDILAIATSLRGRETSTTAAWIRDNTSLMLNVVDIFIEDTGTNTIYRFVCTGALPQELDNAELVLYNPENAWVPLNLSSDLPDDTTGQVTWSSIVIVPEMLFLHVDAGQGRGRLNSMRAVFEDWEQGRVYRQGEIARRGNTDYVCVADHCSSTNGTFDADIAYWSERTSQLVRGQAGHTYYTAPAPAPSNGALHVIESDLESQGRLLARLAPTDIMLSMSPRNVSSLRVEWFAISGQHYLFPFVAELGRTDADVTNYVRRYQPHSLTIELVYEEESEMAELGARSIADQPNFLLPSEPFGSTNPLRMPVRHR